MGNEKYMCMCVCTRIEWKDVQTNDSFSMLQTPATSFQQQAWCQQKFTATEQMLPSKWWYPFTNLTNLIIWHDVLAGSTGREQSCDMNLVPAKHKRVPGGLVKAGTVRSKTVTTLSSLTTSLGRILRERQFGRGECPRESEAVQHQDTFCQRGSHLEPNWQNKTNIVRPCMSKGQRRGVSQRHSDRMCRTGNVLRTSRHWLTVEVILQVPVPGSHLCMFYIGHYDPFYLVFYFS